MKKATIISADDHQRRMDLLTSAVSGLNAAAVAGYAGALIGLASSRAKTEEGKAAQVDVLEHLSDFTTKLHIEARQNAEN